MKNKVLAILLAVLIPLSAFADSKTVMKTKLVGLGMSSELSNYVANLLTDGNVSFDNADFIKWRNAAGSADISVLGVDASNDTLLQSYSASDVIKLKLENDANRLWTFGAASDTALNLTFGDGTASQVFSVLGTTADAADTQIIRINPGGAASSTRGSFINLEGADVGGASAGRLQLGTGGGAATIDTNGTTALSISAAQNSTFSGDIIQSAAGFNILTGVAAANSDITAKTTAEPKLLVQGSAAVQSQVALVQTAVDSSALEFSVFKTRATDGTANTIVNASDGVLTLTGFGANGTTYDPLASIKMTVAGTPGAATDMPGNIIFQTTPDNSATLTTALTIEPDQDILLTGDLYLADGQNLAFTGASGANTACDTTCTGGCVAGWDTGTSVFVACTNAIADTCLCTK